MGRVFVLVLVGCLVGAAGCTSSQLAGASTATAAAGNPPAQPLAPAEQYMAQVQAGIDRARSQMPAMIESANAAAKRVCAGGVLYVGGSQPEFPDELLGRAGGLMDLRALGQAPQGRFNRGDVVLYAARSRFSVDDKIKIDSMRKQGVYVIAFASRKLSADPYFGPDALIDGGDDEGIRVGVAGDRTICPTDSVCNILNAWTWTAEFVSACTRLGRMPICYQSIHLPGGYERAAKYRGVVMFHNDLTVKPIDTGVLGMTYLDRIESYLGQLRQQAPEPLRYAAAWVQDSGPDRSAALFMAHIFPEHFADPRAPHPFGSMLDLPKQTQVPRTAVACVIGYQDPPQLMIDAAQLRRLKLVYTTAKRGQDDRGQNVIYVDPHWPLADGCVSVGGYDIPILPASGVIQAAIYWSLVAEAAQPAPQG